MSHFSLAMLLLAAQCGILNSQQTNFTSNVYSKLYKLIDQKISQQLEEQVSQSLDKPKNVSQVRSYGHSNVYQPGVYAPFYPRAVDVETVLNQVEAKLSDLSASKENVKAKSAEYKSKNSKVKTKNGNQQFPSIPAQPERYPEVLPVPGTNISLPQETTQEEPITYFTVKPVSTSEVDSFTSTLEPTSTLNSSTNNNSTSRDISQRSFSKKQPSMRALNTSLATKNVENGLKDKNLQNLISSIIEIIKAGEIKKKYAEARANSAKEENPGQKAFYKTATKRANSFQPLKTGPSSGINSFTPNLNRLPISKSAFNNFRNSTMRMSTPPFGRKASSSLAIKNDAKGLNFEHLQTLISSLSDKIKELQKNKTDKLHEKSKKIEDLRQKTSISKRTFKLDSKKNGTLTGYSTTTGTPYKNQEVDEVKAKKLVQLLISLLKNY